MQTPQTRSRRNVAARRPPEGRLSAVQPRHPSVRAYLFHPLPLPPMTVFSLSERGPPARATTKGPGPAKYAPLTPRALPAGVRYIEDVVPTKDARTSWINGVAGRHGLTTSRVPSQGDSIDGASVPSTGTAANSLLPAPAPPSGGSSRADAWGASRHAALSRANSSLSSASRRQAPFSTSAPRDLGSVSSSDGPGPKYDTRPKSRAPVPKFGPPPVEAGGKTRRQEVGETPCPDPGIGVWEMERAERQMLGTRSGGREVSFGSPEGKSNAER